MTKPAATDMPGDGLWLKNETNLDLCALPGLDIGRAHILLLPWAHCIRQRLKHDYDQNDSLAAQI